MFVRVYVCMHVCMYIVCMYVCMYVRVYVCTCVCVCVICMYHSKHQLCITRNVSCSIVMYGLYLCWYGVCLRWLGVLYSICCCGDCVHSLFACVVVDIGESVNCGRG